MRSFLLRGDRVHLGPKAHTTSHQKNYEGKPISWEGHHPYTNVLWLAYIYRYLVDNYQGDKKELARFKRATTELVSHLDPGAPRHILSFSSAVDVVKFAVEADWITPEQLLGEDSSPECSGDISAVGNGSILIQSQSLYGEDSCQRRSPRRLEKRAFELSRGRYLGP